MARKRDRSFLSWLFFQDPVPKRKKNEVNAQAVPLMPDTPQKPVSWIKLYVKCGEREDYITVNEFPAIVGRANTPETTVVIENSSVSRHHATINCTDGIFSVADVGAKNGIKLVGERLAPKQDFPLSRGDLLSLGTAEIRIDDFSVEPTYEPYQTEQSFSGASQTEYIPLGTAPPFSPSPVIRASPHVATSSVTPKSVTKPLANLCTKCGFNNSKDAKFCSKCGIPCTTPVHASMPQRFCGGCGTENTNAGKFCVRCGRNLTQGD